MLTLTSLYEKSWDGTYRLVPTPVLQSNSIPSYWPEVTEPFLCGQKISVSVTPPVVPPKTPPGGVPSSWINVYETGQEGQRIIVGRVPSYTEFWDGKPPTGLKPELRLSEVDEYLSKLSGFASPASSLRTLISTPVNQSFTPFPVPPKSIGIGGLGGFPIEDSNSPRTKESDYFDKRINQGDAPISRSSPIGNCWEQICCIGLDVEKKEVTAVIQILQTIGYGGSLCDSTGFEGVGFWLVEPSIVEYVPNDWPSNPINNPIPREGFCAASVRFIGSTKIPVADIPRKINVVDLCLDSVHQYDARSLQYTASVPLSEEDLDFMLQCSAKSPRLPILHAVMGWNTEIHNEHYGGMKHQFWDSRSVVVQYPVTKLKQIRKECAVGILWEGCPRVLFSSVVRRATNPTTGKSIIDKLAIAISPAIVEQTRNHLGVMFCVLKGDANLRMQRTGILNPNAVVLQSIHYKVGDLPHDRVITPFDLENGNWMICAVFGPMKDPIDWNPARDMILTGNSSHDTIRCVGTVDTFAISGIEVAGPQVIELGFMSYREEDNADHYNYPPCRTALDFKVRPDKTVPHELDVYYPVDIGSAHIPHNLKRIDANVPIVILCPANSSYVKRETLSVIDYRSVVTMLVQQGCVVIILATWSRISSFYLVDTLKTVLQHFHSVFQRVPTDSPLFLLGHSTGGGQVAKALSRNTYSPDSEEIVKRIKGGMLLAPTVYGGDLHLDVAPFLVMYGALDSDGAFVQLKCSDNTYTDYLASPVRYYTNGGSEWQALILVDGGTHFRWIDRQVDDYTLSRSKFNEESAKDYIDTLVLDGPNDLEGRDHVEHKSIFLAYLTYLIRAQLFEDTNLLQFFFNSELTPPDILALDNKEKILSQLHRLASMRSVETLNNTFLDRKGYRTRQYAERVVKCDGTVCPPDMLKISSVTLNNSLAYPLMDTPVVFAAGRSVEFRFDLRRPFEVMPSDVLRFEYTIQDIESGMPPDEYNIFVKFRSSSILNAEFYLRDFISTRVGIVLPSEVDTLNSQSRSYYGNMSTVEEFNLPLAWLSQPCFQVIGHTGPIRIDSISIECTFLEKARFGLGTVQILSTDGRKVVLP